MKTINIFLLCLLGAALLSTVLCNNASGPEDCCFKFYPRPLRRNVIASYYYTDHRCPKAAVVVVTKEKKHQICVDPNSPWIEKVIRRLDEKNLK